MLHGRDVERAQIGALLEAARASRSGALVLRGEAGIGKSALLEDTRDRATDMHVLTARGIESESELPFAALHQLIRPALSYLERLPAPQSAALGSALGLQQGAGQERFLVFAGCLSLLSELAERRPVLCLVDDAHWLDAASSDALQFVARRLGAEGIVLLFSAREGEVRSFEAADVPTLMLDGLDAEAAASLLARGPVEAAPSVRERLVAQTRGNALALVELPSALSEKQLRGEEPLPEALPMTRQLESVFLERVRRLPREVQQLLLIAAADDSEDIGLVARAGKALGAASSALDAAERANLVSVRGGRVVFRHPLVRSAVYESATSSERRAAHGALAAVLAHDAAQADRRAWHLAASAFEHDEEALHALEAAAERAEARTGHGAAARAFERAAELSGDPAARGRRLVRAARAASLAGQDERAAVLANRALPLAEESALRAELARVFVLAAIHRGRPREVIPILVDASHGVTSSDPATAVELLMHATAAAWQAGDRAAQLEIAGLAASVTPPADDERSIFLQQLIGGFAAMLQGDHTAGAELLGEARAWGSSSEDPRHAFWAGLAAARLGDDEAYGVLLNRAVALARSRGEIGTLAEALGTHSGQLMMVQRIDEATVAASEAVELAREIGADNLLLMPRAILAIAWAIQGREDEARRQAEDVLDRAMSHGLPLRAGVAVYALVLTDLGRGRWAEAFERLDSPAAAEPIMATLMLPDKVEAAVRAGKPNEARAALEAFETWVESSGATAASQRRLACCRALLAEGEEAAEHFEEALRLGGDARPFDLARVQLFYGEYLRRERRRTDARTQLRAAFEAFERLRAEPWAERARGELRATGETARKRDPSTIDQLTPQELQISRLVAEGLSNKDVAAQLFLSPRTIESHLRNVFSKLGVRSRTQLARLPLGDEASLVATPSA